MFEKQNNIIVGYDPISDIGLLNRSPIEIANINSGHSVLHIGSGGGDDCFAIRRIVGDNGRVLGIDMSHNKLAISRQNAGNIGYNNVTFFQSELNNFQFYDGWFDIILSSYHFNLFSNNKTIINEIFRILKPQGRFVITDLIIDGSISDVIQNNIVDNYFKFIDKGDFNDYSSKLLRKNEYLGILNNAGFQNINVIDEIHLTIDDDELLLYLNYEYFEEYRNNNFSIRKIIVMCDKP
jgi:ubiquinone/menaquinone biosynthesis C-methylase UbiE